MADTTGPSTVYHYCLQLLVTSLFATTARTTGLTTGHTTAHHCCLPVHHYWSNYCLPLLISLLADTTGPSTVCHYCSLLVTLLRTIAVYLFTTLVKLLFTITELTIGRHYWAHYCSPLLLTTVGHTTVHFWSHYRAPLLLDCSRLLLTLLFTMTAFTTVC